MIIKPASPAVLLCLLLAGCSTLDTVPQQDAAADANLFSETDTSLTQPAPAAGLPVDTSATAATGTFRFWQQLRSGLQLGGARHVEVQRQLAMYRRNASQVETIFQRGGPYLAYIQGEVSKRGFPSEITLLPFVESSYDPFAYSHGRAAGLWQFIPGTARMYGLQQDWWYDGRRDVVASTRAALDYLDRLHQYFDGDWLLALAAYNSGEGTVSRAIARNRKAGKPVDFWHLELPPETSVYVPRLLAISTIVENPGKYDITLEPLPARAGFEVVGTGGQLDLAVAAELAGLETDELYRLNPGFNRWATHPDGPHQLAIPNDKAAAFRSNLAALPESERVKWVRHKIRKGDTLSQIANRYDTTIAVLQRTNKLDGTSIRIGRHLLVPVAAKNPERYAALTERLQPGHARADKVTYQVRNGDSLWSIASKHHVTIRQLTRWNRLDSGSLIKPGQKLVILNGRKSGGDKTMRTVHYRVRSGDSLYRIAQKFNVSIADLRRWNNLSGKKYLKPGQNLKLYVDVTQLSHSNQG
ncbi:MAG TPA: LysM peptidoglycan-binding domain-containing protein [Gammaproteobacteria bacterium]|nr:LysM peptidoglycan-binding domain-containing protein [Gammaproteobacteria bacterium]